MRNIAPKVSLNGRFDVPDGLIVASDEFVDGLIADIEAMSPAQMLEYAKALRDELDPGLYNLADYVTRWAFSRIGDAKKPHLN